MGIILSMSGYDIVSIIIGIILIVCLVLWVLGFILSKKGILKGKLANVFLNGDAKTNKIEKEEKPLEENK